MSPKVKFGLRLARKFTRPAHMLDAVCERSAVRSVCLLAKTSINWMAYKPLTSRRPNLTRRGCVFCSLVRLRRKRFKKENEIKWKGFRSAKQNLRCIGYPSFQCKFAAIDVFALWNVSRRSKKTRKLFIARWRKILWGIIGWSVVCLRTQQFLQVLQSSWHWTKTNRPFPSSLSLSFKASLSAKFLLW